MKKILALMLSLGLMLALVGCGGDTNPTDGGSDKAEPVSTSQSTEEPDSLVVSSIMGQWECVEIEWMDNGEVSNTEDIESLFETKASDMFKLTATPDGKAEVVIGMGGGDSAMPMVWIEQDDGSYLLSLDLDGVREVYGDEGVAEMAEEADAYDMVATLQDNQITVIMDSSYESDGEQIESVITYTLDFVGMTESNIIEGWDKLFTSKQSRNMSNFMQYGHFLVVGDTLYADMGGESLGKGNFSFAKLSVDEDVVTLSDEKTITEGINASYLTEYNGYIYAMSDAKSIIRVKMGDTEAETIYEGDMDYMQILNDRLYFTNADHALCSTDMDGQDLQIVMDKEVYYAYFIDDEWLIYQDDADSETIHMYNMETENDVRLTEEPSYGPVIGGEYLFYGTKNGDDGYFLNRLNLFTGVNEKDESYSLKYAEYFVEDGQIIPMSAIMKALDWSEWKTFSEIPDNGYTKIAMYSNGSIHITEDDGDREIRIFNHPFGGCNALETNKIGYR